MRSYHRALNGRRNYFMAGGAFPPFPQCVAFYDLGALGQSWVPGGQTVLDLSGAGNDATLGAGAPEAPDDPPIGNSWLEFDGVDDLLGGLPAKAAAWTVVNADDSHVYAVDSDGGSYVDGLFEGGASEFGIGVGGTYTGRCSLFLQYDRVLLPGEHRSLYFGLIPLLMAKGITPFGSAGGAGWGEIGPPPWGDWNTGWGASP